MTAGNLLRFEGHLNLRQRLLLATISGKPVRIDKIRPDDDDQPGLADYEASFLRLLEKLTNGSTVEISYTGTTLVYRPGVIMGGTVYHECPNSRAIGYFLEPVIALAPFAKKPVELTLTGVTNDNVDVCVDTIRTVTLPTLKKFLPESQTTNSPLDLKITKRGAPPLGGGEIIFRCPTIRQLKPTQLTNLGHGINKIRGIAYATRVSPQMASRIVDSARVILTRYIPDVYLYTDVYKGNESGKSPGFGISLVAESTAGGLLSAECAYQPRKGLEDAIREATSNAEDGDGDNEEGGIPTRSLRSIEEARKAEGPAGMLELDYHFPTPEDLGVRAARLLLTEIKRGGCVDSVTQWLAVLMLALGPEDVGKVRIGNLSRFTVGYLRDLKKFLGVSFKITAEEGGVLLTCVGMGYVNVNKNVA
ncbi:hypothetical protein HDU76_005422 [Blyttiomyces sp. JEL0837]|nr:hypothetical protein HDU76_005422 [Blyttiomyces sp. JEL0837]